MLRNMLHFFVCLFGGVCLSLGLIYTMLEINSKQGWGWAALYMGAAIYFIFWFCETTRDREREWEQVANKAWERGYRLGHAAAKRGDESLPS